MTPRAWVRSGLSWTMPVALAAILLSCGDLFDPVGPRLPSESPVALELALSSLSTDRGQLITIALTPRSESRRVLAVEAYLRFDPERLKYVGSMAEPVARDSTIFAVSPRRAGQGEVRMVSVNPMGILTHAVLLGFEVLGPSYDRDLAFEAVHVLGRSGSLPVGELDVRVRSDLPDPAAAHSWTVAEWHDLLDPPSMKDPETGPMAVPGEALLYGDVAVSGAIDVFDVLEAAELNVGVQECVVGTESPSVDCVAANVEPVTAPGLGEPTDACPPGLDVCGGFSRTIDVFDVLAIAQDNVQSPDHPVSGEPIPRTASGDTVALSGVIVGTRRLDVDSVYVLQGDVVIGDTAASGELIAEGGTEVRAFPGAGLIVTRNGRIVAEGTASDPVLFGCLAALPGPGCWDGIVVAGSGPVNALEAGLSPAPTLAGRNPGGGNQRTSYGGVLYGGANPADSSGVLRHVVIADAGAWGAALTLAGVGSATVVERVQIARSSATGLEVSGGTAKLMRLLVTGAGGVSLDASNGYVGAAQYVAVQMDPVGPQRTAIRVRNGVDDPDAEPRTHVALWNVTLVGGTAFYRKNAGLVLEDAGATVRNALFVQLSSAVTLANAGACALLDPDSAVVDDALILGVTDDAGSGPCEAEVDAALLAADVDGEAGGRMYLGELRDPFDGALMDLRPKAGVLATTATAAVPPQGLDPAGAVLGAVAPASGAIPWHTGWAQGWTRSSGVESLPAPEELGWPPPDTLTVTSSSGVHYLRTTADLILKDDATPEQVADLFSTFGLQLVGSVSNVYIVAFPDPGTDWQAYSDFMGAVRQHVAVHVLGVRQTGELVVSSVFPSDAPGRRRPNWNPDSLDAWTPPSVSRLQYWQAVGAPAAWACENGTYAGTPAKVAVIELCPQRTL